MMTGKLKPMAVNSLAAAAQWQMRLDRLKDPLGMEIGLVPLQRLINTGIEAGNESTLNSSPGSTSLL